MQHPKLNCYECEGEDCDLLDSLSAPVCRDAIMCWKSTARHADGSQTNSMGCISSQDQVPFYCSNRLQSSNRGRHFFIQCCKENLCNRGPFPVLEDPTSVTDITNYINVSVAVLGPIVGVILLICGIYVHYRLNRAKSGSKIPTQNKSLIETGANLPVPINSSSTTMSGGNASYSHEIKATACGDSTIKEYMHGHSLTSGSGSGLPMLVQRTLAQQVSLAECLSAGGKLGRQIWRGVWRGEEVAVKIRLSLDEAAWSRETEVYARLLPSRHDNILGYVGSDMTSQASCTQLWLVCHYHKPGSLRNYLRQLPKPLNHSQMMNICESIVNGLLYLHTEVCGTQGKPAMAHRNLSSKNIIVKANGTCAIADLAHVVTEERLASSKLDFKQMSKRYMSPEFLENTFDPQSLDTFRQADVYSIGLILWEVCRCCNSNGVYLEYSAPYSEWLLVNDEQDPSIEVMKQLVVTDQRRPSIPKHWQYDPRLTSIKTLIQECWYAKASSRLPILRVKKTLSKLTTKNEEENSP